MKIFTLILVTALLLVIPPAQSLSAQAPTGEIVFVSKRDGGFNDGGEQIITGDIYVMQADGTNVRKLTDTPVDPGFYDPDYADQDWFDDRSPAWSPDGTRIAFGREGDYGDIYVIFANGSGFTRVTLPLEEDYYENPTWSPDGRTVAFEDIWQEGSTIAVTTPYNLYFPEGIAAGGEPDWSPDGRQIVYYCNDMYDRCSDTDESSFLDIYVANRDGSNVVNLTNSRAEDHEPAWSPDGTKLAYASKHSGNYDIYVMNADGSGLQRLMNNGADDREPTWSPDGTQIAFTRIMPNGNGDIFVMNANGGNQTNITNNPAADYQPDWKPATQMNVHPVLLVSSTSGGQVDGIRFKDEDLLAYDLTSHTWQIYFDGSDVGLGPNDVNALGVAWNGDLLLSLTAPQSIQGLAVDDADIVGFIPTALGTTTAGSFVEYFTGANWDLTTDGEDIDAIGFTTELVLSTLGNFDVASWTSDRLTGKDEDLLLRSSWYVYDEYAFKPYFDGSAVGLSQPSEDISDIWFNGRDLYLSTNGPFAVPDVSGDGADIFVCHQAWNAERTVTCTFTPFWDGSAHGFGGEVIDAFDIIYTTGLPVTAAAVDEPAADEVDDTVGDDVANDAGEAVNGEENIYQNFLPLISQQ